MLTNKYLRNTPTQITNCNLPIFPDFVKGCHESSQIRLEKPAIGCHLYGTMNEKTKPL